MTKKPTKPTSSPVLDEHCLRIDELRLVEEWVAQPVLIYKALEAQGQARRELDAAKDQMAALQAHLSQQIRSNPEEFGIDKITEKAIESTISLVPDVVKLQATMRQLKYSVDMYAALTTALDHKKKALENIVVLQNQAWHAEPRATAAAKEAFDQERVRQARHPKRKA